MERPPNVTTHSITRRPVEHSFGNSAQVPPSSPLAASVQTITTRCAASGGVMLSRNSTGWKVSVSTGCAAFRLPVGMTMDAAATPSLFPNNPDAPGDDCTDMSTTPDPFVKAMGPMANWDWAVCPMVNNGKLLGILYLFSDWDRPFTNTQVAMATMGADMLAHTMTEPATSTSQLAIAEDDLKTAISLLNHDLRSPLSAILGFSELLKTHNSDPETVARYAGIMTTGGDNMSDTLDSAVLLMRTILGTVTWQQTDTPITAALHGLNVEGTPQGCVHWDAEMVHRALGALAQYTGASTTDRLVVMVSATHVHITIGASEETAIPLDHTLKNIPVQMARHIIESHDGTLHTNTTGSWFQILLPKQPTWANAGRGVRA